LFLIPNKKKSVPERFSCHENEAKQKNEKI